MKALFKILLVPAAIALATTAQAAPGNLGAPAAKTETTRGLQAETTQVAWKNTRANDRRNWRRDRRSYHSPRHYRGPRYHHYGPRYYGRPYYAPPRCYWSRYYQRRVCRY